MTPVSTRKSNSAKQSVMKSVLCLLLSVGAALALDPYHPAPPPYHPPPPPPKPYHPAPVHAPHPHGDYKLPPR